MPGNPGAPVVSNNWSFPKAGAKHPALGAAISAGSLIQE
jgi:hypothetical protein